MPAPSHRVILASDFDDLIQSLASQLQKDTSCLFSNHVVCLPDLSWKRSMIDALLSKQNIPIISGVVFRELSKLLVSMVNESRQEPLRWPPKDVLALHILSKLDEGFKDFEPPKHHGNPHEYFKAIADQLADTFIDFGKYGGHDSAAVLNKNSPEAQLFKEVFDFWDYPYQHNYDLRGLKRKPFHLHLFNFAFIPPVYRAMLGQLPDSIEVTYYQFSYSSQFWTDIVSDSRAIAIETNVLSQGASFSPMKDLHTYLLDRNPLLANFGFLHLVTKKAIEQSELLIEEKERIIKPCCVLQRIQDDIHSNRKGEKKDSLKKDTSLSFSKFASKREEVVYTRSLIESILERHPDKTLQDIRLYASNMEAYAPFIKEAFAQNSPEILTAFFDEKLIFSSPFFECMSAFFAFFKTAPTHKSLFDFFALPFVREVFDRSIEEIIYFSHVFKEANFVSNINMFENNSSTINPQASKTFKAALHRLVMGALFLPKDKPLFPLPFMGKCDLEKLISFAHLVITFYERAAQVFQNTHTLESFQTSLFEIIDFFGGIDSIGSDGLQLKKVIDLLLELKGAVGNKRFDTADLIDYVLKSFDQKKGISEISSLNVIICRDFTLKTFEPSSIVIVLGLNQDDFPRVQQKSNVEALKCFDYIPSSTDEDRALFLSLITQARLELHLSYTMCCEKEGVELFASPLFTSLHQYVEKTIPIENRSLKPLFQTKPVKACFLNGWQTRTCSLHGIEKQSLSVSLDELKLFSSHPIRYFFRHFHQVRLPFKNDDRRQKASWILKKRHDEQFCDRDWQRAFIHASSQGHLPSGRYFDMSHQAMSSAREDWCNGLKLLGIESSEVFSLTLSSKNDRWTMRNNKELCVPPLSIKLPYGKTFSFQVNIEGCFSHVCSKGLLLKGCLSLETIIKHGAEICTFLSFKENSHFEKKIWFLDGGNVLPNHKNPKSYCKFFEWFLESRHRWFPLLPRWASFFEKKQTHAFEKAFAKVLYERKDPYLNHSVVDINAICFETIVEEGHNIINTIFNPLYKDE